MKELQKHIKNKSFSRVYLLYGDETYQILRGKKMLKNALVREDDSMNFQEYREERPNLSEIRDTAQTVPFFSDWRLIILDRTKVMKTGKDDLVELMEAVAATTVLLICEQEVDKRSKAYKWIKKNGFIREFLKKNNKENDLIRFTAQLLKRGGKQIREQDARYLVNVTGSDFICHGEIICNPAMGYIVGFLNNTGLSSFTVNGNTHNDWHSLYFFTFAGGLAGRTAGTCAFPVGY